MKSEWKTIRADEFCSLVTDGTHDSPKPQAAGRKLITSKHLKGYYLDFESANWISSEDYERVIARSSVEQWDILYSMIGTIGNVYLEKNPVVDYACKNVGIFKFGGNCNKAYWMYYYLKSPQAMEFIKAHLRGTTQLYVPLATLREMPVPVPDEEEMNKIVAILRTLDDKIQCSIKINDNLEQQAVALFKSWFVDFSLFGGTVPENWEDTTLENITTLITRGIAPKYSDNSDQTVVNQKCIRNHTIDLSLARTHTPKAINEKWLQFGDLLINSTGDGTLGRVAQVWFTPKSLTVDSHVTIVRPAREELIFYIGLWGILHEKEIESLHTGSTGQTELPRDRVKMLKLLLPDNISLSRFNSIIAPMASTIILNQEENQKLASLRDTLLPKLMSGEIDVSSIQL